MKFTQLIYVTLTALVVNGAGIPTQNNNDGSLGAVDYFSDADLKNIEGLENTEALKNIEALKSLDTTEPKAKNLGLLSRLGIKKPSEEEAGGNTEASEEETRDKVVVVMKTIVEDVLDAFTDFGAAAGIEVNTLLEDTGYELDVSPEKQASKPELEKRTAIGLVVVLIPVILKLLKVVLRGVASLTGAVCGKCQSRPALAFAASAAGAISAIL